MAVELARRALPGHPARRRGGRGVALAPRHGAAGSVRLWLVVAAAGCSVRTPDVAPLSATVLAPAMSAPSLIVTALFCSSLPVVESKRATALSVALPGPKVSAAAQVRVPEPLFCSRLLAAPCADGNVSVWFVVVAAGRNVSVPLVEPFNWT
jgi:hypothetical protein